MPKFRPLQSIDTLYRMHVCVRGLTGEELDTSIIIIIRCLHKEVAGQHEAGLL